MSRTVFITGATGLVGSNLCATLVARGDHVRALVRGEVPASLDHPQVELVSGDVSDSGAVHRAAAGADALVHCAAILGGVGGRYAAKDYHAINVVGTRNVLDAAPSGARVVVLSTVAALQTADVPVSETSPIPDTVENESAYTESKRIALAETVARAAAGIDACVVVPGGIYGPAPSAERALAPTSFNYELRRALGGEVDRYARVPLPWSFVDDVVDVCLRAVDVGRRGHRYLAMAPPEEALPVGAFLTLGCRVAGVDHVVADVGPSDDPAFDVEFAGMARLARRSFPNPLYDNRATVAELGVRPTPIKEGLATTVAWLRELEAR